MIRIWLAGGAVIGVYIVAVAVLLRAARSRQIVTALQPHDIRSALVQMSGSARFNVSHDRQMLVVSRDSGKRSPHVRLTSTHVGERTRCTLTPPRTIAARVNLLRVLAIRRMLNDVEARLAQSPGSASAADAGIQNVIESFAVPRPQGVTNASAVLAPQVDLVASVPGFVSVMPMQLPNPVALAQQPAEPPPDAGTGSADALSMRHAISAPIPADWTAAPPAPDSIARVSLPPPPLASTPIADRTLTAAEFADNGDTTVVGERRRVFAMRESDGTVHVVDSATLIGRSPTSAAADNSLKLIAVSDRTQTVSKTHAALRLRDSFLFIEDLDSSNGTIVAHADGTETRVRPGTPTSLVPGDIVRLGSVSVSVHRR